MHIQCNNTINWMMYHFGMPAFLHLLEGYNFIVISKLIQRFHVALILNLLAHCESAQFSSLIWFDLQFSEKMHQVQLVAVCSIAPIMFEKKNSNSNFLLGFSRSVFANSSSLVVPNHCWKKRKWCQWIQEDILDITLMWPKGKNI